MKKFGFFNSVNGDRKYLASDISDAFNIAIGTGLASIEDSFKIVPYEKMTVKMKSGGAMIKGCYISDDEEEIIQLDTAHAELNRIDRIVLRYDKFERNIKTVVMKGTPALNPTPPSALRTENQFDLVLADIRINKAVTDIKEENINDMRDSDLCGYLGGKVLEKNIFGVMQSLGKFGYRKLPGGFIIQWGEIGVPANQGYAAGNYPIEFPNGCMVLSAAPEYTSTALNITPTVSRIDKNKYIIYVRDNSNKVPDKAVYMRYLAIGY
jgi:hypothetical protein